LEKAYITFIWFQKKGDYGITKRQKTQTFKEITQYKGQTQEEVGSSEEKNPAEEKVQERIKVMLVQSEKTSSAPKQKEEEQILNIGPIVLTGGHGGAVPAFIVWLMRKILPWSESH
jgi:hypothetical protein